MEYEEKVLAILARLEAGEAKLEVSQARLEAGQARLEADIVGLKAGQAKLEENQAVTNERLDKMALAIDNLTDRVDSVDSKMIRIKSSQAEMHAKLDSLAAEDRKILECVFMIHMLNKEAI